MKSRAVLVSIALLAIVILFLYVFIPSTQSFGFSASVTANSKALERKLFNGETWKKWWPYQQAPATLGDGGSSARYRITDLKLHSVDVSIQADGLNIHTELIAIIISADSANLVWRGSTRLSLNPITRLRQYFGFQQVEKEVPELLSAIKSHYGKLENLYEVVIREERVAHPTLISTAVVLPSFPAISDIYKEVERLAAYTIQQGASKTGHPMVNVMHMADTAFLLRVAIPVNKVLPQSGNISHKWMLEGGRILVADVKGGASAAIRALEEVDHYVYDHQLNAPAIPFMSLVTDRRNEPDSNKWVTRIYYPIM